MLRLLKLSWLAQFSEARRRSSSVGRSGRGYEVELCICAAMSLSQVQLAFSFGVTH